ncbi:hypothetical protein QQF64_028899 [Cirrhinus molitorella]|uniref:DUF5641 domain-containing protein n=1 Tax=Cirrhinus molitorella TaxID=172907 RepID=A0ABR3N894_9TELE
MDPAESDALEKMDRPRRKTNLPSHLGDYEVGYQPAEDPPPKASSHCLSQPRSSSRKTSRSGASSHSRTSRRSVTSTGVYLPPELSSVQTAILEEKIKQRQLDSLRQQVTEDSLADVEYQRLQAQAKEAQHIQEEALRAREALSKQIERQRKLQQAETELEVAKLVSSMLIKDSGSSTPVPVCSADSHLSPRQLVHVSPALSPPHLLSSVQQPSTQSPAVTSTVQTRQAEQSIFDDSWVSQPSFRPLRLTAESGNVPFTAAYHPLPQAVPSPVSKAVVLKSHVGASIRTATTLPLSTSRPSVLQQPTATTMQMSTTPYVVLQTAIPPVTTPARSVTNPQASVQQPTASSHAQPPPFLHDSYPAHPGTELLFASAYGIPQPKLPVFESGNESDFALLKLALDNLLTNHRHLSEQYKYHVLLSHLKLPSAQQLAKAYMYHPRPYSAALQALQDKYGQPRQLLHSELGTIMSTPPIRMGNANAFDFFALSVQSLVGMLRTLEGQNGYELMCGSHVDRLLSKLPAAYRDGFIEYCLSKGILQTGTDKTYTLPDLASWLETKSQAKRISNRAATLFQSDSAKSYELIGSHRWSSGPAFLLKSADQWPSPPLMQVEPEIGELKKATFIGTIAVSSPSLPDPSQFSTWRELIQATVRSLHGAAAADSNSSSDAAGYTEAEKLILAQAQSESFPLEVRALKTGQAIPTDSRLGSLAPEYDEATGLIRVGGRLRRADNLDLEAIHPILLDPGHPVTKLLIQETDQQLLHPGSERVLAELRRQYWVLRGREAIRKHQHTCRDCQFWHAKPQTPQMADLPSSRLQLYKPPFYSTGVDCFGPFVVKIGRHQEKRWGILYKCMTTRCVHLDLLEHLDTDAFLLSLRRFIARRGKPMELLLEVEGILNSKPLGYVSSDVADLDPVTPSLLLMGRRDASLPQVLYDSNHLLGKLRWRHSQVLADNFWTAFIRHYLPSLQERHKWRKDGKELTVGQVVLIVDPQLARALWPVGTVTETLAGADDKIRTARVKVKEKTYTRPVVRLIPLPRHEDNVPDTADRLS